MKKQYQRNLILITGIVSLLIASSVSSFIVSNLTSTKSVTSQMDAITESIGPSNLPEWHTDAQVQLGWAFADPTNPQDSEPLPGWDKAIGEAPTWSYDPDGTAFGNPGQWYIRIPNVINDHPSKKFWICWVYEFDTLITTVRSATNIDWFPDEGSANSQYDEVWFDSAGNPTTNYLQAAHAQVTHSLDLFPNPQYEDVWLGVYGGVKHAVEVYILTLCVEEAEPVKIGPGTLPEWHADAQVQLGWIFDDPTNPQDSDPLVGWDKAIGEIPTWSYDPDGTAFDLPAQWYIRIPNVINDHPSKKVWISWVYEYDPSLEGDQVVTSIDWDPNTGMDEPQGVEDFFDSAGNPTTDPLEIVYGRITGELNLYPNPQYEDIWLGVYGESQNALEVYIKTLCVEEVEPVEIGPGTLPEWHADAQVQLGWIFDDPTNPQDSDPLVGWDKAIGEAPTWSYDPERVVFDRPAQWYIRIPNVINDHPSKKVWISWIFEYDGSLEGEQSPISIDWSPNTGMENPQSIEEWFDSEGILTTESSEAVYGRITASLDLFPNPQYEDIWLGVNGESQSILEVYLKTICIEEIEPEPEPEETDVLIDVRVKMSSNDGAELKIVVKLSSDSMEIKVLVEISLGEEPEVNIDLDLLGSFFDLDTSLDIKQSGDSTEIRIKLKMKLILDPNEELKTSIDTLLNGSLTDLDIAIDLEIGSTSS